MNPEKDFKVRFSSIKYSFIQERPTAVDCRPLKPHYAS